MKEYTNKEIDKMIKATGEWLKTKKAQNELLKTLEKADEVCRKLDEQMRIDPKMLWEPIGARG